MGCYKPLKGFPVGTTDQGRTDFIITSARVDHIEIDDKGNIRKAYTRGIGANTKLCIPSSDAIDIPCGQCIGCRLDYSNQWASRCLLEMKMHKNNCFMTLTYDEEHVPERWHCRLKDRAENVSLTLEPRHVQLFWKRLRKGVKKGDPEIGLLPRPGYDCRYFLSGEYGDRLARPHYHAMVFGFDPRKEPYFDDFKLIGSSEQGYNYYESDKLNDIWKLGNVIVADASWETAAYTARYVMKKLKGIARDFYDENCIKPEFVMMSRKPGIGYEWYDSDKKCYATFLRQYLSTEKGSRELCNIRYFDNKLDEEYPFDFEKIKANRVKFAEFAKKLKMQQTSLSYLDLLEEEEKAKEAQTRIFKRIEF